MTYHGGQKNQRKRSTNHCPIQTSSPAIPEENVHGEQEHEEGCTYCMHGEGERGRVGRSARRTIEHALESDCDDVQLCKCWNHLPKFEKTRHAIEENTALPRDVRAVLYVTQSPHLLNSTRGRLQSRDESKREVNGEEVKEVGHSQDIAISSTSASSRLQDRRRHE